MITIIAGTDYSALAENAVAYAAAIAKQYQARLVIFNAYTLPVHAANALITAAHLDELLLANGERLRKKAEQVAEDYQIQVRHESSFSMVPEELENLLVKYQAELVVLGMEPGSLTQDLLGNTTTAVIRKLNCPVLAVPADVRFDGLKKILFACDLVHGLPAGILPGIKAMAMAFQAEVEVFFVEERPGTGLTCTDEIADGLEGIAYSFKKITSGAVVSEIKHELLTIDADLLIMVPKEYGFWSSVAHRSKTRMMASGLPVPLLAISE